MQETKQEKNRVLIIEQANTEIKDLINNAMLLGINKSVVKEEAKRIINSTISKLKEMDSKDKKFLNDVEIALKQNFFKWYQQMVLTLQKFAKKDKIGVIRQTLEKMDTPVKTKFVDVKSNAFTIAEITPNVNESNTKKEVAISQDEISNLRDFMTVYDEGAAGFYTDYVNQVKNSIIQVESDLANGNLTLKDSLGRIKSVRNMAEIKTRYDLIQGDMQRLSKKGVKYVVATAHVNCSERCSWWQGKTFIMDIDIDSREMNPYDKAKAQRMCKPIKKEDWIDGRPTYSLADAIECGFLSYNCQHRVVQYFKGIQPPTYTADQVEKKRDISTKQRQIENKIRQLKRKKVLEASPKRKKQLNAQIKKYNAYYNEFCTVNKVPTYQWRLKISEIEKNFNPELSNEDVNAIKNG